VNVVRLYGEQALMDVPGSAAGYASVSIADATQQLARYVEQRLSGFRAQYAQPNATSGWRVVSHLRLEAPAEELAQIAADLEADLVVVGTHSRKGIARLVLGSVAEAVVRLAPCPVLVVRPKALPDEGPRIEPPCPACLAVRRESGGSQYWCAQHRERHGQRHTYHQRDRVSAETEMPLTFQR